MKAKDFVSIIFSSIWARVGLFMDLLGIVIYVKPELTEKLSFSNLISQYLWLWIAVGSIILVSSIAWEATKKIGKIRESSKLSPSQKVSIEQKDNNLAIGIMNGNIIQPDGKKKENLNKLDILTHKLVNEILLYKVYSEKEIPAKELANQFFDFSQNNRVEMSPILEKLVFDKMFREVRSVISQIVVIHGMIWVRNGEIASKVPFENLSPLPKIDGIEEELVNLRDKIHEEIYNTSHP